MECVDLFNSFPRSIGSLRSASIHPLTDFFGSKMGVEVMNPVHPVMNKIHHNVGEISQAGRALSPQSRRHAYRCLQSAPHLTFHFWKKEERGSSGFCRMRFQLLFAFVKKAAVEISVPQPIQGISNLLKMINAHFIFVPLHD